MKTTAQTIIGRIFIGLIIGVSLLSYPGIAFQSNHQRGNVFERADRELYNVGSKAGFNATYSRGTLQVFIASIIRELLTFLGIVFFVLVLYAGVLWMTAGGKEDQVERARNILSRAGIGLAIVLLAYAITVFVMRALMRGAGLDPLNAP